MKKTVLLIPEKTDTEFEQVFATWTSKGGEIIRLGKYWIKDDYIDNQNIAIYGNQTFALVLEQVYNVKLVSPDDRLISKLDKKWIKRNIEVKKIYEISETNFPIFIKPAIPKMFIASIFNDFKSFQQITNDIEKDTEIILSSVITDIKAEARGYLKNGIIKDLALYEGNADLQIGWLFLEEFAETHKNILPEVVVTDIAYSEKLGWFILEFNACWGAGLNNCNTDKVIDCIIEATRNESKANNAN